MKTEEVLDGGRCVEDITLSCHHQHETIQCLNTKTKWSLFQFGGFRGT